VAGLALRKDVEQAFGLRPLREAQGKLSRPKARPLQKTFWTLYLAKLALLCTIQRGPF